MKKVAVNRKKFVNGFINIDNIPESDLATFVLNLKTQIIEYYKADSSNQPP